VNLGLFLAIFHDRSFDDALDRCAALGLDAVEIATGNYPGDSHCQPNRLLADRDAITDFTTAINRRGLTISALSQHGNPLHPDEAVAASAHATWRSTVRLAAQLGVGVVNAFSGCPGDHDEALRPNWVTCSWPEDYQQTLAWQWEEKVIPYWTAEAAFAAEHGVTVGIEMHPGFVVYNPATLMRLRDSCGPAIAANFDPSHLFWQRIDPAVAIRYLGQHGALAHVAAKDTQLIAENIALNGVLETRPAADLGDRAFLFRTIGFGQGEQVWRDIVSSLQLAGYDGTISIEHEDRLLAADDGVEKAVRLLRELI
jgi:sugar phosphate isomerase/epimerase